MTSTGNARLAGFMFLFYIATAFPNMILSNRLTSLANIAQHPSMMRVTILLSLITILDALFLGVALYALTRDYDRDLALLALACRAAEGMTGIAATIGGMALLFVAQRATAADAGSMNAIGAVLLKLPAWSYSVGATLFAAGSTLYAYLFVRSRIIPTPLAWLGLAGSLILAVGLPLEILHLIGSPLNQLMWIPIALFELTLGPWLLIKGVKPMQSFAEVEP
jgi:uncharacterized protein DUF4386